MEYELMHFGVKGMRWGVRKEKRKKHRRYIKGRKTELKNTRKQARKSIYKAKGLKKVGASIKANQQIKAKQKKLFNSRTAVGQAYVAGSRATKIWGGIYAGAALYGLSKVTQGRAALNLAKASNVAVAAGIIGAKRTY